jgi:hypothetical protein
LNIAPSEQFLAACRAVLGDDDPQTIQHVLESHDPKLFDRLRAALADLADAGITTKTGVAP